MNILIELNHPAHFHLFRNFALIMHKKGNRIGLVVKQKDVLLDLVNELNDDFEVYVRTFQKKKSGFWDNIKWFFESDIKTFAFALKFKPDVLLGSNFAITHVGKILKKPSFLFAEDDAEIIPRLAKMAYPFVSHLLTPTSCKNGKWEYKSIKYNSYHELAYLHPNNFIPEYKKIEKIFSTEKQNFLIRLSGLSAHHDKNISGISPELIRKVIKILSNKANVFITSERELEAEFEPFRIALAPSDIHHAIYYSDLLICDSQTMTAEAAVLGTPSLRFNDFVGKIGYLEELEHKYGLTYGIKTDQPDQILNKIRELLAKDNLKTEWQKKRKIMLEDMIDVTAFMVWLIENYPQSAQQLKDNPDIQNQFK